VGAKSVAGLLAGSFQNPEFARRACLIDAESLRRFSYSDMDYETSLAAGVLKSFYVRPGDTVSLLLENGLHFFMPWLGAMRIGAVAHPINCLYTSEQIIYALKLCETRLLVVQERYVWDEQKNAPSALLRILRETFPEMQILVTHDPARFESEKKEKGAGWLGSYSWSTLAKFAKPYGHIIHRYPEDIFQLICTSGTTGNPKAVAQTNSMFLPDVEALIKTYSLSGGDRTLLINRLFHVNAQVTNFFPMALLGGTTILASPDPKKFLKEIARWGATYSSVIPPTLKEILKYEIPEKEKLKNLRFLIVGADKLTRELHREFMGRTGVRVHPGWGMTETLCWGSGTAMDEPIMYGSIGKPLNITEMKIINPETGEEAKPNENGLLIIRGPNVFKEYFKNSEATKKAFLPHPKWEGWFDTGDLCYRDLRGTFYWVARASADTWKVRGEFVVGPLIDEYVEKHPAVDQAMAVPVVLEGETETALCVVKKEEISADAMLEWCEEGRKSGKLEKHYKIKKIIFVTKIELGDTGKRSRKKMAELAAAL